MAELEGILKNKYDIYRARHMSHIHLQSSISDIDLTDTYLKLDLSDANFEISTLGGFSLDSANSRIYWDSGGAIGLSLPSIFIGDAGLQITSNITTPITITLGLFVDDAVAAETPLIFEKKAFIQSFGANDAMLDDVSEDLLQSGSFYDFRIKASSGDTPTLKLDYFQTVIKRD